MKRRNGFTLVETIAAVLILAIAIPPMLWSLRSGQAAQVNAVLASRARWLAVEKLEDVIADRHSGVRGYDWLDSANYPDEPAVAGFPGFQRSVAFSETGADLVTPGDGYTTVTVTVGWTDADGGPRTMVVSTVLTEYPS